MLWFMGSQRVGHDSATETESLATFWKTDEGEVRLRRENCESKAVAREKKVEGFQATRLEGR